MDFKKRALDLYRDYTREAEMEELAELNKYRDKIGEIIESRLLEEFDCVDTKYSIGIPEVGEKETVTYIDLPDDNLTFRAVSTPTGYTLFLIRCHCDNCHKETETEVANIIELGKLFAQEKPILCDKCEPKPEPKPVSKTQNVSDNLIDALNDFVNEAFDDLSY